MSQQWSQQWLAAALIVLTASTANAAGENEQAKKSGEYIRVEIRGVIHTGVVAIGGETTGTTITADGVAWELELGEAPIGEAVGTLNGRTALVTGELEVRKGVEIPQRWVVHVKSLKSAAPPEQPEGASKLDGNRLRQLLAERRDTLEQAVVLARTRYEQGQGGVNQLFELTIELTEAKLALADGAEERIGLLNEQVETLRQLEAMSKTRAEVAAGSPLDHLKAKARRLEAEARLLQEQHRHKASVSHQGVE
ncbi:MAG: hypothetical protein ACREJB_16080 [Planctomycetaceae bacterium]